MVAGGIKGSYIQAQHNNTNFWELASTPVRFKVAEWRCNVILNRECITVDSITSMSFIFSKWPILCSFSVYFDPPLERKLHLTGRVIILFKRYSDKPDWLQTTFISYSW